MSMTKRILKTPNLSEVIALVTPYDIQRIGEELEEIKAGVESCLALENIESSECRKKLDELVEFADELEVIEEPAVLALIAVYVRWKWMKSQEQSA